MNDQAKIPKPNAKTPIPWVRFITHGIPDSLLGEWLQSVLQVFGGKKLNAADYIDLARLNRPIGIWLLLFPSLWAIVLVGDPWPDPVLLGLFTLGAVVMRSAGCVINDILDSDLDRKVERTQNRPMAAGRISVKHAWIFAGILLAAGGGILLCLNNTTKLIGLAAAAMVVAYPLMKRVTWWPQVFLGLTINMGAIMGWTAAGGDFAAPAMICLYLGCIAWTVGYDTIYANADKTDDVMAGIKSTAVNLGKRSRSLVYLCYILATVGFFASGLLAGTGQFYAVFMVMVVAHFGWQVLKWDPASPKDCLDKFTSNQMVGWLMLLAASLGKVL